MKRTALVGLLALVELVAAQAAHDVPGWRVGAAASFTDFSWTDRRRQDLIDDVPSAASCARSTSSTTGSASRARTTTPASSRTSSPTAARLDLETTASAASALERPVSTCPSTEGIQILREGRLLRFRRRAEPQRQRHVERVRERPDGRRGRDHRDQPTTSASGRTSTGSTPTWATCGPSTSASSISSAARRKPRRWRWQPPRRRPPPPPPPPPGRGR